MNKSKATMIGEIVEREAYDAINSVIAELANEENGLPYAKLIQQRKNSLAVRIRNRIERRYTIMEILDAATWNKRKIGKDE